MKKFPIYKQNDSNDCGPTCLKIITKFYGKNINIQELRELSENNRQGSNLMNISTAAEKIGFKTLGVKLDINNVNEVPLPCILHWNSDHYVVLYEIENKKAKLGKFFKTKNNSKTSSNIFKISDPAIGLVDYDQKEFLINWIGNNATENTEEGIALLFETTPAFKNYQSLEEFKETGRYGFWMLFEYIFRYKKFLIQLTIGLLASSLINLLFPFLTQSIVDIGIQNQDIHFIYLILFAQLFLFTGKTILEFIRSWITLHLSTRISISLISDFFIKLMNLPISFFDVRMTGDIMERINDHQRIEKILTSSSLNVLFSIFNMVVMSIVLLYFNFKIFLVFFGGSFIYFTWIILFLNRRESIDYKRFAVVSQVQSKVLELINGMQEIKLHNAEKQKRWSWEYVQSKLFKVSIKGLVLEQIQNIGSNFINEIKNIIIIFLSAKLVIDGQITLGMMLAINSIVGSLNAPIIQLINFIREAQDAKISLARLSEIHDKEDEIQQEKFQNQTIPKNANIVIKNLNFRYAGTEKVVLENLNLTIPANKITAIVGSSGSGKTTLMKLLLKFYEPISGEINLIPQESIERKEQKNYINLKLISQKSWRSQVGTVMQEGYIFNDTIANNIAIGFDTIDKERLFYSTDIANIKEFIQSYPLGFNTKIGMEGIGISTGQKQRLLIARAVYKNPEMLFFDEATSSLDANNEKEIINNLNIFFKNKTVIVIAHRLSTVLSADQIVVLEKGKIVEVGNHINLLKLKGAYYELVRNQLQLGT